MIKAMAVIKKDHSKGSSRMALVLLQKSQKELIKCLELSPRIRQSDPTDQTLGRFRLRIWYIPKPLAAPSTTQVVGLSTR